MALLVARLTWSTTEVIIVGTLGTKSATNSPKVAAFHKGDAYKK